jgi:hypothetical protein
MLFWILSIGIGLADAAPRRLDRPYHHDWGVITEEGAGDDSIQSHLPKAAAHFELQTPVKDQGDRGSCSIFSATALLEATLIQKGLAGPDVDLSEEWLAYLANRNDIEDGSSAPVNLKRTLEHGFVSEDMMPYNGEDWTKEPGPLAPVRCGHLDGRRKQSCHVTHWDPFLLFSEFENALFPEFMRARSAALSNRHHYLRDASHRFRLRKVSEIKGHLARGLPLILEVDYYYEAWNDPEAAALGLNPDPELHQKGVIGYPVPGGLDRKVSLEAKDAAGHSVLVVGYDDTVEITTTQVMRDGRKRTFTTRGVYFIKNSWGTEAFGAEFEYNGRKYPGYAMIAARYAEDLSGFFALDF